ncbi:MAG: hypothetical protein NXI31_21050 [bacterium]|nr:hypothetical protein [bacterium]
MPAHPPKAPDLALALALALAAAFAPTANCQNRATGQEPRGGRPDPDRTTPNQSNAAWIERLGASPSAGKRAAVAELAAAIRSATASVTILEDLLRHDDPQVVRGGLAVARTLGPLGKPLQPLVLQGLQQAPSWATRAAAARALAAMGAGDDASRAALLHELCTSDVPRLRGDCARALAELFDDFENLVLAKVGAGTFTQNEWAIDALRRRGQQAVPTLIRAVVAEQPGRRTSTRKVVASTALARIGWRAVDALERAGLSKLAERALRTGPLVNLAFADQYECKPVELRPAVDGLPEIAWETSSGHGGGIRLWRASEGPRGFRVRMLTLAKAAVAGQPKAEVHELTIPRRRARALTRQLGVLPQLELRPRPEHDEQSAGWSSNNFYAGVRCRVGDEVVLAAAFAGYSQANNIAERFPAEAATYALRQACDGDWTSRPATAADHSFLTNRPPLPAEVPKWFARRLERLTAALPPKSPATGNGR